MDSGDICSTREQLVVKVGIPVQYGSILTQLENFYTGPTLVQTVAHTELESLTKCTAGNQTSKNRMNNDNHPHDDWKPNFNIATRMRTHILRLNLTSASMWQIVKFIFQSANTLFQWCETDFRNKASKYLYPFF